jgi:flagellum-specific ATP synthase
MNTLSQRIAQYQVGEAITHPVVAGKLVRVVGLTLEAVGCSAAVGSMCKVETNDGFIDAEVVGFSSERLFLMPSERLTGVLPGAKVIPQTKEVGIPVGMELLGRVLDGMGNPIDGKGEIKTNTMSGYNNMRMNPLSRKAIKSPLDTGIKAINALLTVGQGQRMGLFAGSGVGKSVLLGMMTRGTNADVVVVGLICYLYTSTSPRARQKSGCGG